MQCTDGCNGKVYTGDAQLPAFLSWHRTAVHLADCAMTALPAGQVMKAMPVRYSAGSQDRVDRYGVNFMSTAMTLPLQKVCLPQWPSGKYAIEPSLE